MRIDFKSNLFKIIFTIELNVDKLIEFKENNPNFTDLANKKKNLSINDQCAADYGREVCENGGVCEHSTKYGYVCHCPPYFTGKNCEKPIRVSEESSVDYSKAKRRVL